MAQAECEWTQGANLLMNPHDRFTRAEIRRDFDRLRRSDSINLDSIWRVTPVADNRYLVLWHQPEQQPKEKVIVDAVIEAPYRGEEPDVLKQKMARCIIAESHGRLTPFL